MTKTHTDVVFFRLPVYGACWRNFTSAAACGKDSGAGEPRDDMAVRVKDSFLRVKDFFLSYINDFFFLSLN